VIAIFWVIITRTTLRDLNKRKSHAHPVIG
jgi:hypothetical protein